MRVFVAPDPDELDLLAGEDGDFVYTRTGELLVPPIVVCDGEGAREACGCGRSLTGVETLRGTTLAQVRELPPVEVVRRIKRSRLVREWGNELEPENPMVFTNEQLRQVHGRLEKLIRDAEGVPGDVFRVENGPNDDPYVKIRRAT